MHQQRHPKLFHFRQRRIALAKIGHAGIGIRRRPRRVELDRLDEAAGPPPGGFHRPAYCRSDTASSAAQSSLLWAAQRGCACRYASAIATVVTGGRRFGMMIARANCRALCGNTDWSASPSRRCRCQSSGRVIVILFVCMARTGNKITAF